MLWQGFISFLGPYFTGAKRLLNPNVFFPGKKKKPELVLLVFWGLAKNGRTFNLKLVQEAVNFFCITLDNGEKVEVEEGNRYHLSF